MAMVFVESVVGTPERTLEGLGSVPLKTEIVTERETIVSPTPSKSEKGILQVTLSEGFFPRRIKVFISFLSYPLQSDDPLPSSCVG
jgi:hypothetical protein